jgi:DNA modification methylase
MVETGAAGFPRLAGAGYLHFRPLKDRGRLAAQTPRATPAQFKAMTKTQPKKRTSDVPRGNGGLSTARPPVDRIMRAKVATLVPYIKNPRVHAPDQVDQIAASMREFGQTQLVVVDEKGEIIAGHGRILAVEKLGWSHVMVGVAVGWSETQKHAYRIADNQLTIASQWDSELLRAEVMDLKLADYNLELLGFEENELLDMTDRNEGIASTEDVPDPPKKPVSRTGDLWVLGRHRILCGDSTNADDVVRLMDGKRATLFSTDPPYAVGYTGGRHPVVKAGRAKAKVNKIWIDCHEAGMGEDERDEGEEAVQAFFDTFIGTAIRHAITPDAPWYCWCARRTMMERVWHAHGAIVHQDIVWVKTIPVMTYSNYRWGYELCLYGWVKGHRPMTNDGMFNKYSTVWNAPNNQREVAHPTLKPTLLFTIPIESHTKGGDICYEPFSGGGTQIIAAEMAGRCCYAMEISQPFVDVAVQRWEEFTGQKAKKEGRP